MVAAPFCLPCRVSCLAPTRRGGAHRCQAEARDMTAGIVEAVAVLALKSRLKDYDEIRAEVYCSGFGLLAGQIDAATIRGRRWRSPQNLSALSVQLSVGRVSIDYGAVLAEQRIVLRDVPTGTARFVFTAQDFANFLVHPLMTTASSNAVQGRPFAFNRSAVATPPSPAWPRGCVELTGVWGGDGQLYRVTLAPAGQAKAVTATAACDDAPQNAALVSAELTRFFNGLMIDLQGAELRFASMSVRQAYDVLGRASTEPSSAGALSVVDLSLNLRVRSFPPLNLSF